MTLVTTQKDFIKCNFNMAVEKELWNASVTYILKNLEEPLYTHKKQQNLDITIGKEDERTSIQNQTKDL